MTASILFSAISRRALSMRCWPSSTVIGDASDLRDFKRAIGAGSDLDSLWAARAPAGVASATVVATPALCRKFRRARFMYSPYDDWIEYHRHSKTTGKREP